MRSDERSFIPPFLHVNRSASAHAPAQRTPHSARRIPLTANSPSDATTSRCGARLASGAPAFIICAETHRTIIANVSRETFATRSAVQRAGGGSNTQGGCSDRQTQRAAHETRCAQRDMYAAWRTQRGMTRGTLRIPPNANPRTPSRAGRRIFHTASCHSGNNPLANTPA